MRALSFEGSGFEYFKIWIVNLLLTIVTLGLYYPWAKVRTRRYFYANSVLEGRNFDYHATGKQLFVGYLIALVLFIAYVVIQNISPVGGVIVFLIFFLALPWIIWRSLKFNLRMTSFSNVRFGFDGLLGGAYINYLLLPILLFLSLYAGPIVLAIVIPMFADSMGGGVGLIMAVTIIAALALAFYLFAFIKKRNSHYTIDGTNYGQGKFMTSVETKGFALILAKTLGLAILLMIAYMILMGILAASTVGVDELMSINSNMDDPEMVGEAMSGFLPVIIGLLYLGLIILSMLIVAYSYTRQRTYVYANSNLDQKFTFESTLTAKKFAWVSITNFLAIIFSLSFAMPWAMVRMKRLLLENTLVDTSAGFDEYVTQQQKEESSLGEQIGDAFDVDVGIGF